MAMTAEQVTGHIQILLQRMTDLEASIKSADLPRRLAGVEMRAEAFAAEHKHLHDDLQGVKTQMAKVVEESSRKGRGDDDENPSAKEIRARLDKMVEVKTHIVQYDSITKSAQPFKDFLEDVREHIEHFDPFLGEAVNKVVAVEDNVVEDALEKHLRVQPIANRALRRLLLQYTTGEAKKFIRARKGVNGLDLWRAMAKKV